MSSDVYRDVHIAYSDVIDEYLARRPAVWEEAKKLLKETAR